MRIALDARYLAEDFSGIGVYSENLLEAIARADTENEYVVFVHASYRGDLVLGDNFEIVPDPGRPVSFRTMATFQSAVKRVGADLLHTLFPLAPAFWRGRLLVTVHDLQPLLDPEFTGRRSPWKRSLYDAFYHAAYPLTMRRADYLVCDSYATKETVMALLPDLAGKLLVVHGGVGADCVEPVDGELVERTREKFGLPERFLFYLGSTRPNKNLMRMLDAFEEFVRTHPEQDDLKWVLVVNQDRFFDPVFAAIRERDLLGRVQIHEQVSEAEKRVFYRMATLLYFVTKFEGFGLPVLEAQAQGLPVLASTHGALPEVAGPAAILRDPDDTDAIVDGLERFFADEPLRGRMVRLGLENVRRFTWENAAKETISMYEHLLA